MERVVQEQTLFDRPSQGAGADNVLRGVKVLGFSSRNRNRYTREAVEQALHLYSNVVVNADHPEKFSDDPKKPPPRRRIADRLGVLENVRLDGDVLRGDLVCNPEHPLTRSVVWFAQNKPHCIGLSHHALTEGKWLKEGVWQVNKIAAVHAVDVVANPATSRSLYEGLMAHEYDDNAEDQGGGGAAVAPQPRQKNWRELLEEAVGALVRDPAPGAPEMAQRILKILKPDEELELAEQEARRGRPDAERLTALEQELSFFRQKDRARRLLEEAKIPAGEAFVTALSRCGNEAEMRALLEERRQNVPDPALQRSRQQNRPRSLPPDQRAPAVSAAVHPQMTNEEVKRFLAHGF